jgi:hypothetical protein
MNITVFSLWFFMSRGMSACAPIFGAAFFSSNLGLGDIVAMSDPFDSEIPAARILLSERLPARPNAGTGRGVIKTG